MAYFNGVIGSDLLGMQTNINVIIPDEKNAETKTLYLYHGLGDNCQAWNLNTSIARYANQFNYAVIMPEVQRSWYTNYHTNKYYDYVSDELPRKINTLFNIDNDPSKTYVAGLSMGGYGACKVYFSSPERYAGMACFSGAVYIFDKYSTAFDFIKFLESDPIFEEIHNNSVEENDFLNLIVSKVDKNKLGKIYLSCGTSDFFYTDNNNFVKLLTQLGIKHTYDTWAGDHDWEFWDTSIVKAMKFFEDK